MQRRRSPSSARRRAGVSSCSAANSAYPVPDPLGVVHREVGAAQQIVAVVAVVGDERDADARLHVDRVAVDDERRLERLLDLPDDGRGAGEVGALARQDAELVPAESRHRVADAQAADEPLGDELQELVAVVVAERVVDLLELVQVHDQQRQRLARPERRPDRLGDAVAEQHAVGQAGEVVVQRLVLERLGVGLALGDVAQAGDVDRAGAAAPPRSGRAPSGTSCRPCGDRPTRPSGRCSAAGSSLPRALRVDRRSRRGTSGRP